MESGTILLDLCFRGGILRITARTEYFCPADGNQYDLCLCLSYHLDSVRRTDGNDAADDRLLPCDMDPVWHHDVDSVSMLHAEAQEAGTDILIVMAGGLQYKSTAARKAMYPQAVHGFLRTCLSVRRRTAPC